MSKPIKAQNYPGFYEIPGYSRYCIDTDGNVLNKVSEKLLKGSTNPDGYFHYRIQDDLGVTLTYGRHRILCDVFKADEKYLGGDRPVVNHKNGIKGDDRLSNLEWTTYQGNSEHAGWNQLTAKSQPIAVREVDTGKVTIYPSIIECARAFGTSKDFVNWRIKAGEEKVFPERKQYRSGLITGPWKEPKECDVLVPNKGTEKALLTRNLLTGKITVYRLMSDLAAELDVPLSTITTWLKKNDQPVLPGLLQIKRLNDGKPWRDVEYPYLEIEKTTGNRVVKATNTETGKNDIYYSARECALHHGVKPTALQHRLKTSGTKIFSNGFTYSYLTQSNKGHLD